MRTGKRCTTLIQLPVAFCAGMTEKAEPVPPASPATPAMEFDRAAVEVRLQLHGLPDLDVLELTLLEVGIHIGLTDGDDAHQGRANLHALAHLDAALGDDTVHRGTDNGAIQIEGGLLELRTRGDDLRVLFHRYAGDQHLGRPRTQPLPHAVELARSSLPRRLA